MTQTRNLNKKFRKLATAARATVRRAHALRQHASGKFKKILPHLQKPRVFVPAGLVAIVLVHTFYIGVVARYITYDDKTYPNVVVAGQEAGGLTRSELAGRLSEALADQAVTITYRDESRTSKAKELGLSINESRLEQLITRRGTASFFRPWFIASKNTLPVGVDEAQLASTLEYFEGPDFKRPKNAAFTFTDGGLSITDDEPGVGFDVSELVGQLETRLGSKLSSLQLTAIKKDLEAAIQTKDIRRLESDIKAYATRDYQIFSPDKDVTASKADLVAWLTIKKPRGNPRIEINKQAVLDYVEKVAQAFRVEPVNKLVHRFASGKPDVLAENGRDGKTAANIDSLAQGLVKSLEQNTSYKGEVALKDLPLQTDVQTIDDVGAVYTYEVITWGSVNTSLDGFAAQVAQTLGDGRGWSAAGIRFNRVASGGQFSVVLAEPARVANAAPICDAYYSCRVGRHVIINDDRWRSATPAWNNAGGGLRDYRHMLINHEIGHWLGFGHRSCPAPGAPAPVMQQQSISLQGCAFNPWPTLSEVASY